MMLLMFFFIALPMEIYVRQEKRIDEIEEELFHTHGENQELKQILHMIQARNEGIEYIDELPEGDLPWNY